MTHAIRDGHSTEIYAHGGPRYPSSSHPSIYRVQEAEDISNIAATRGSKNSRREIDITPNTSPTRSGGQLGRVGATSRCSCVPAKVFAEAPKSEGVGCGAASLDGPTAAEHRVTNDHSEALVEVFTRRLFQSVSRGVSSRQMYVPLGTR